MEKRLMIPGVGQAGREQARCEDRPSCEGWQQPRWSSPRRTRTTGSWLPRGSHILVLNCGWVVVKRSKLCNENTNSMFIWHIWPFLTYYISCFMKNRNFSLKILQELRMLSSVLINCQVTKICHESRFLIVSIVISVLNVTSPFDRSFRVFSNGGT